MSAFFVGEPHINALLTWTEVAGRGSSVPDPRISRDHGDSIGRAGFTRTGRGQYRLPLEATP